MAANMYLKFSNPDIAGGAQTRGHVGEIEVLTFNHGFDQPTRPTRSGGGTVEQAAHQNLSFTKYMDAASSEIMRVCGSGRQIERAVLACYRADGSGGSVPYLKIEMQHVIISNFSIGGDPGAMPVETVTLDYGIVTYVVTPEHPEANTSLSVSHDLLEQTVR